MEINKNTAQAALNEIESLRKQNELMAAKLDMFDKCFLMFNTTPAYPSYGAMHPDAAYELRKAIAAAEQTEKAKETN
jgi:hypothetical protein